LLLARGWRRNPTQVRLALLANGYDPVPQKGKEPHLVGWQTIPITEQVIRDWEQTRPDEINTGVRNAPVIDIDVKDEAAAAALEELVDKFFPDQLLRRVGWWPKRAFLFRAPASFAKLKRVFKAPDGSEHAIEILGHGQQLVVEGIHPDTHGPYTWTGGEPW